MDMSIAQQTPDKRYAKWTLIKPDRYRLMKPALVFSSNNSGFSELYGTFLNAQPLISWTPSFF